VLDELRRAQLATKRHPADCNRMAEPGAEASRSIRIDSLRALAALGVLGIHVGHYSRANLEAAWGAFTSHLNVGVTLFFVISGFLLYRPWAAALLADGAPPSLSSYARRRVLRIVPAYWLALTLLALWPGLEGVFTRDWWVYYGFAQSLRADWTFRGLIPAWSLSVEAHYYALLPLFAGAVARPARGRTPRARLRIAGAGVAALALAGAGFCFEFTRRGLLAWTSSLPAHLLWFAAGMAAALAQPGGVLRRLAARASACWLLAAALYAGLCLVPGLPRAFSGEPHTAAQQLGEHVAYAAIALLVALPGLLGEGARGAPARVLGSRTLAGIGIVSYGIFLWHQPLLAELAKRGAAELLPGWPFLSLALGILPLAIACGALSWRLVERPALQLGRR
jgi:peptidoglycan/LPS O-acetylase OafA/YrhL